MEDYLTWMCSGSELRLLQILLDGSLPAISRSYGIAAKEIFNPGSDMTAVGPYNAELIKQLGPEMQARIQNL